ncbi:tRNA guanosine(34) transglycosylase Tgt [Candidatus Pacearchaeota archaeon]|nr:tRNA guanosine(34) transglycosylase Tgt [Candidatus Pacearchaeota archaeon]
MAFTVLVKDAHSLARVGRLKTRSGSVETPVFMPVATKTAVKHISPEMLEEMGAQATISNSFVLSLRPGAKIVKKVGGIHTLSTYTGVMFTDSGGFQMYSPSLYKGSNDLGVEFKNPYSGERIFMTPEQNMQLQLDLGSDVAMCFDTMPLIEHSKDAVALAVNRTSSWARRCKETHDTLQKKVSKGKRQLLFGIVQGGVHDDLRRISAGALTELDFDGFAIGGLALGEAKEEEYRMIEVCQEYLPRNKPVYLMGAGNPIELLEAIERGCDIFDSRFPTMNARHGNIFSWKGKYIVTNAEHKASLKPLDESCDCSVCKRYSRAYVCHLIRNEEGVGYQLASYHNLYFLQELMRRVRKAIKVGTFGKFKKTFIKNYSKK